MIVRYRCDKCEALYDTMQQALDCEAEHRDLDAARLVSYQFARGIQTPEGIVRPNRQTGSESEVPVSLRIMFSQDPYDWATYILLGWHDQVRSEPSFSVAHAPLLLSQCPGTGAPFVSREDHVKLLYKEQVEEALDLWRSVYLEEERIEKETKHEEPVEWLDVLYGFLLGLGFRREQARELLLQFPLPK